MCLMWKPVGHQRMEGHMIQEIICLWLTWLFRLLLSQRSVFWGGPGPGEADRPDVCREVHPQKGSEGEGEQHRERDRRAEEVSAVRLTHTHMHISLLIPGYRGNCASPLISTHDNPPTPPPPGHDPQPTYHTYIHMHTSRLKLMSVWA